MGKRSSILMSAILLKNKRTSDIHQQVMLANSPEDS
jgi:hypothetical protein